MVNNKRIKKYGGIIMQTIPYGHQWIDKNDIKEVTKVLCSDWVTQGPKVKEFEDALCKYTGAKYAVAVSSGTAALHIACLAAGISKNDEVITSPITFVASANCVLYCGGRPVFADIEEDTANISPQKVERQVTKKTKAIIPVHFAGHPCDLKEIQRIAKKHNLFVIEDAAHALGAQYHGQRIGFGKYSDMTIFSFHPVKSITTGEGGAVLTNNQNFYKKLLMLRTHGITKRDLLCQVRGEWYYEMQTLGYNYRITDIQAALGISQLAKLNRFIVQRRKIASIYNAAFANSAEFDIPIERKHVRSSYHLYPIKIKNRLKSQRKKIFSRLRKYGLGVQVHYIPVYLQPYYQKLGYRQGICPVAENFYQREVSIPLYYGMTKDGINHVIKTVKEMVR
jgi:UDP-4-amino-4,6-dideoxy-N-acetyl-beta-L-altrosamine transaminase